ncbi:MAG: FAD-binding oxidoreductase [Planctomycetota bacterium]|nr:FAD-binding oxidoreductase [Planctomycetota bacterium]
MFPTEAKVVVIGGGVLGTSAAFQLADDGNEGVVLLDRGPIASGTTPFAAGQTGYLTNNKAWLPFTAWSLEYFENFEERTGYPIDFRQTGSLRLALTEKYLPDLEARIEAGREYGEEFEMISPEEATKLAPGLDASKAKGILLVPRDGHVDPKSVAVAFAAAAKDRGVSIHTNTAVQDVVLVDGKVKAVKTDKGTIQTDWVVLAAGAWNRQFARKIGVDLMTVPVRHQAFVTAPLPNVSHEQPIVRITEPQIYVRHEAGGLLVGGYGYRPLSFDMDDFPDDFEIPALASDKIYIDQLHRAATEFFPALKDAVIIQERRGLPTIAPDAKLVVSEIPNAEGLIVASGCMVGGISKSPGVGRVIADIVGGKKSSLPAETLRADRFGEEYADDTRLRSKCEQVYSTLYLDVI